jgi:hypothetical protein
MAVLRTAYQPPGLFANQKSLIFTIVDCLWIVHILLIMATHIAFVVSRHEIIYLHFAILASWLPQSAMFSCTLWNRWYWRPTSTAVIYMTVAAVIQVINLVIFVFLISFQMSGFISGFPLPFFGGFYIGILVSAMLLRKSYSVNQGSLKYLPVLGFNQFWIVIFHRKLKDII